MCLEQKNFLILILNAPNPSIPIIVSKEPENAGSSRFVFDIGASEWFP